MIDRSFRKTGYPMKNAFLIAFATFLFSGCIPAYQLVQPGDAPVGNGSLSVTPRVEWNELPNSAQSPAWEEAWTQNGPLLESVVFVSGLPEGRSLVKPRKKDDARVAPFRADMSPADLVSMIESYYRVGGVAVFTVDSVEPMPFLGGSGLRMSYHYAPTDGIGKRGIAVLRVVDHKLFLMRLDGVTSHYFDAAKPQFEQLVASATLKK